MGTVRESFRTHSNYIKAFSLLAAGGLGTEGMAYKNVSCRVHYSNSLPSQSGTGINIDQVRLSLRNAWGTELLFNLGESIVTEDELVRVSNNWNVIQTYYIIYHSTQALAIAKGLQRPDSHIKTQRTFANYWANRPIDIPPWTLASTKDGFPNIPIEVTINDRIHSWTNCTMDNCWSLCSKALRTTRKDIVDQAYLCRRENKLKEKKRVWKEEEQQRLAEGKKARKEPSWPFPNLTKSEKVDVNRRVRPITLIDYLYRLRIRTNYEDVSMFTDGPEDDIISSEVRSDLRVIAGTTLFLHELFIATLVGKSEFLGWVTEWIDENVPDHIASGLANRYDCICEFCT